MKSLQKLPLTDEQIVLINSIQYEKSKQEWLVTKIKQYVSCGYPIDVLVKNYDKIILLGKDSSSMHSYITRYGNDLGIQLFKRKVENTKVDRIRLKEKFGVDEAERILHARSACLDVYIERHGVDLGKQKWDEYLNNRKIAYENKRKNGHRYPSYNLDYYKKLHGEEKGTKIFNDKINKQRYKVSKQYYIEQYGPIEGPIKCRENKDHCSITYFVNCPVIYDGLPNSTLSNKYR